MSLRRRRRRTRVRRQTASCISPLSGVSGPGVAPYMRVFRRRCQVPEKIPLGAAFSLAGSLDPTRRLAVGCPSLEPMDRKVCRLWRFLRSLSETSTGVSHRRESHGTAGQAARPHEEGGRRRHRERVASARRHAPGEGGSRGGRGGEARAARAERARAGRRAPRRARDVAPVRVRPTRSLACVGPMWIAVALPVLIALAGLAVWAVRTLRRDLGSHLSARSADVDRRLEAIVETMDRRLGELDTKVDRRLESASKTTEKIHERLGEVLLENLLRDRLPASAFSMQYRFDGGEIVDAVVRVGQLIPIDSKFPLDNFNRIVEAENDDAKQLHEKAFARDVKGHIDAICAKYIRPAEGTYDFAFMYVPVEAVYYELVCGKTGALLQYAHEKRVFPVSPTTFTAYLQVIVLGMRGMQIEQHAHEVMGYVADLQHEFDRFTEEFELVGKHLGHAQVRYTAADKRLDKFATKLEQATDEHEELEDQTVLELPSASADAA